MRTVGIRQGRQNLSQLLEQVRGGREVVLTDRGRPVARLVPPRVESLRPFTSHRRMRASVRLEGGPLSGTIERERADRF